MWHVLFKTTNLVTGEYFYGIHFTVDMYFGRKGEGQWDTFCGSGARIEESVAQYGRRAHVVESLFAHHEKEIVMRKFRELPIDYNDPLCLNGLPLSKMDRTVVGQKISSGLTGYKQTESHKSKTHRTHSLKRWVNNGVEDRYILKTEPIPEGFVEGRMFKKRAPRRRTGE